MKEPRNNHKWNAHGIEKIGSWKEEKPNGKQQINLRPTNPPQSPFIYLQCSICLQGLAFLEAGTFMDCLGEIYFSDN